MSDRSDAPTRRKDVLILAAVLVALYAPVAPAGADVFYDMTLDLGVRDDARIFLNVANSYFAPAPAVAVSMLKRCPAPEDDYPVVMLLARASKRPPDEILRLRLDYLSWSDIMFRMNVPPSVLFVGLDRDPGPPYGKAWGHWKKHPHDKRLVLRDRDVVELAKLQVAVASHRADPYTVIAERHKGVTIERYVADRNRGKYTKTKAAGGSSHGKDQKKHGDQNKPKGHGNSQHHH